MRRERRGSTIDSQHLILTTGQLALCRRAVHIAEAYDVIDPEIAEQLRRGLMPHLCERRATDTGELAAA